MCMTMWCTVNNYEVVYILFHTGIRISEFFGLTLNDIDLENKTVNTHIGFDDAEEELKRMEEFRKAQAEVEQKKEKPMSQKMFKVI